jgi:hypothetical protein
VLVAVSKAVLVDAPASLNVWSACRLEIVLLAGAGAGVGVGVEPTPPPPLPLLHPLSTTTRAAVGSQYVFRIFVQTSDFQPSFSSR